jgi:hypothetical protein
MGAHASFTLGCRGRNGGLGLELGGPAGDHVYIGASTGRAGEYALLPFFESSGNEFLRYAESSADRPKVTLKAIATDRIRRDFDLGVDRWTSGDLSFAVYSPVEPVPEPGRATRTELMRSLRPSVLAELKLDNRRGRVARTMVFGYAPQGGNAAMRRIHSAGMAGIGRGASTAIFTDHPDAVSATAFTPQDILAETAPFNYGFALGDTGLLLVDVPAGKQVTARFAICFHRAGIVTTGLPTQYFYTRWFRDIESVGAYTLAHFDALREAAEASDRLLDARPLNPEQRFQLIHAIRSYYASTQLLEQDGKPVWVVNEGEYRMLNTFDLTVDQLFYEMKLNPWTVRNVLDLYVKRYAYTDRVHAPGGPNEHPGGIAFTHDMGQRNHFSPPGRSSYELTGLSGCFSHMTHEQLVNWILCAAVYAHGAADRTWRRAQLPVFKRCLRSLLNRDAPRERERNGIMGLDSSRTGDGAEITTYDSLDASLGQARNNGYMAVKTWAAYLALEQIFRAERLASEAVRAQRQAERAARTIAACVKDGELPALLGEPTDSRIIPVVEGLVFPWVLGLREALSDGGPYATLIDVLRTHIRRVLRPGVCLYPDGAWKLSSTADNSWLSKIYLCQFIVREILGLRVSAAGRASDRAHARWLLHDENVRWAWSDQMKGGLAKGSLYYPRGVTAILWMAETSQQDRDHR